ncbi:MAG: hypothetical protein ABIH39_05675 [Candidatus Margulisiibacteriota bacterium]
MRIKVLIVSLIIALICMSTMAQTPLTFVGVREAAMGGAYVAIADDINALHTNPAGLIQIDGFHLNMLTVQMNAGTDIFSKIDQIQGMGDKDQETQTEELGDLIPLKLGFDIFGPLPLVTYTGSAPGFLKALGSNMGFGGFARGRMRGSLVRPTLPTVVLEANADAALMVGFAKEYKKGLIPVDTAIGYSLKYISRVQTSEFRQSATQILNGEDVGAAGYSSVTGIGLDLGALFTSDIPYVGKSKVGLVVQNLGATVTGKEYDVSGNVTNDNFSEEIPVTVKAGLAWTTDLNLSWPLISGLLNGTTTFAADYDIAMPNASFWKRLHFGAEKRVLGNIVALRTGLNQGYITCGLGVNWFIFNMDYAYYVEEMGNEIGVDPYDYHIIEVGMAF